MGLVELDEAGNLRITLESAEDVAAIRAAHRSAIDPDPLPPMEQGKCVVLDVNHAPHVLIAWWCGFRWSQPALERAIDELAPYARQSLALHASSSLKSHGRTLKKLQASREAQERGSASGSTGT